MKNPDYRHYQSESNLDADLDKLTKSIAKGSGIIFGGNVIGKFAGFALNVVLARLLGPASYGLYALTITVLVFGQRISQLGLTNGLVRFVAADKAKGSIARLKGTIISSFSLGGLSSLVIAVGIAFAAPFIAKQLFRTAQLTTPLRFAAVALPFYALFSLTSSALRGFQQMKNFAAVNITRNLVNLAFIGALVALGFGVVGAVMGFALASLFALLCGLWFLWRVFPDREYSVEPKWRIGSLLRFSLPMYLAGFSYLLLTRTDLMMLGYFAPSADVGAYRSAVALTQLVVFGLAAINTAFAPMISDLYHRRELEKLNRIYKTTARWIALLSLIVALPLIFFPREILGIYGQGFLKAASPLVALAILQLVNAGVGSVGFMLQMSDHQDFVLGNNLFTALLNLGLNFWWIPKWGILGAAMATGVSLALNNILGIVEVGWLLKMHPFSKDYLRLGYPTFFAIVTFVILKGMEIDGLYGLFITMTVFCASFFALSITHDDRIIISALWKKVKG